MRWTELPHGGAAPSARSSHSLTAATDDLLVLFGGEHAPRQPVEPVAHLYSLSTKTWSAPAAAGAPPSARLGHAAAAVGGRVYVHAGRSEVALESALDDLHVFDTATAAWAPLAPRGAAVPEARNFHAAAADDAGGAFYVFGGCGRGGRLADLWRYDARAGAWARLPDAAGAAGRGGAGLCEAGGALWVVGGFTGAEAGDVHRFDLAAGAWEAVAPAGAALRPRSVFGRAAHACGSAGGNACAHAGHIVLFGGEVDPADAALGHAGAGEFAADVLCLDTARREWHAEAPGGAAAPAARGWAASAATPAGLALHGGVAEGNGRLSDLWLLDIHAD
jgi:hypothetical protein